MSKDELIKLCDEVIADMCHFAKDLERTLHAKEQELTKTEAENEVLREQNFAMNKTLALKSVSADSLEQPHADKTELADAKAELKKHLSSSVDYDLVDGIRQLAQAAISWKENCETLERQLVTNGKVVETVTTTNTGTPITDYAAYYVSEEAHRLIFGEGGELCGEVVNAEVSRRLEREIAELRERLKDHVVHLESGAPGTAGYSGTIIVAGTDLPEATDK